MSATEIFLVARKTKTTMEPFWRRPGAPASSRNPLWHRFESGPDRGLNFGGAESRAVEIWLFPRFNRRAVWTGDKCIADCTACSSIFGSSFAAAALSPLPLGCWIAGTGLCCKLIICSEFIPPSWTSRFSLSWWRNWICKYFKIFQFFYSFSFFLHSDSACKWTQWTTRQGANLSILIHDFSSKFHVELDSLHCRATQKCRKRHFIFFGSRKTCVSWDNVFNRILSQILPRT